MFYFEMITHKKTTECRALVVFLFRHPYSSKGPGSPKVRLWHGATSLQTRAGLRYRLPLPWCTTLASQR